MYFVEEFNNILKMFTATQQILSNYPTITPPVGKYDFVKYVILTLLNSFINLEGKQCIKDANSNGISVLELLRSYCARIKPLDVIRCKEAFNSTRQYPNELTTKYIARFCDAKLLAKSVGVIYTEEKLIDKFLNSMSPNTKCSLAALNYQTQRRNKELTTDISWLHYQ